LGNERGRVFRRTARAAETRSGFLAAVFAQYRAVEQIDDVELAYRLTIGTDRLAALSLCLRPRSDCFGQDVAAISRRFGADAGALASVIRQIDALDKIGECSPTNLLAAARDAGGDEP
jgi:hypothetical protein